MAQRPVGVSVIAVLEALGGVLLFILAAFFAALSTAGSSLQDLIETYSASYIPNVGDLITAIALGIAAFFVILGILAFVSAYGLWTGKGWAWYLSVILLIIGLIFSLLSLPGGIIGLIIGGLILWYFFRPYVKAFFGLGPAPQPPPAPPA
jgi:uncharacterized membrane protein